MDRARAGRSALEIRSDRQSACGFRDRAGMAPAVASTVRTRSRGADPGPATERPAPRNPADPVPRGSPAPRSRLCPPGRKPGRNSRRIAPDPASPKASDHPTGWPGTLPCGMAECRIPVGTRHSPDPRRTVRPGREIRFGRGRRSPSMPRRRRKPGDGLRRNGGTLGCSFWKARSARGKRGRKLVRGGKFS
jgi:hypothetical protein